MSTFQSHDSLLRVFSEALNAIPEDYRPSFVLFLDRWIEIKAQRKALIVKILVPELNDKTVAALAGVNRTTLFTWPTYLRLKAILKESHSSRRLPLHGATDEDGEFPFDDF